MHLKVELIVCVETFLNAPLPARLTISTASDAALSLASVWIKECWEAQPECKATTPSSNGSTQLLDLDSPRTPLYKVRLALVNQTQRSVPYVALSYCWGPPPGSTFKLTTIILDLLSQGIMVSQFPRAIQDAIHIAGSLNSNIFRFILFVSCKTILEHGGTSQKRWVVYAKVQLLCMVDNSGGCFAKTGPAEEHLTAFPATSNKHTSFSWAYAGGQVEYPPTSPQYLLIVAHDVLHGPDLLTRVTQTGSNLEESNHKRSETCLVGYYLQVCGPVSRVYPKDSSMLAIDKRNI